MIDFSKASYGCELELANVDTSITLPEGNTWCTKDGSICNSNGTANDPKHKLNRFGGEIQVRPASSPEELLSTVEELYKLLNVNQDCFNFTTNLHVHIRIPGLSENLDFLKKTAIFTRKYDQQLFNMIEPIPKPNRKDYPSDEAYDGAHARYKRRKRSHQYSVTEATYQKMLSAETPQQFWEAHAAKDKNGKPLWHLVVRAGVNLKQLWEDSKTVEFRHFTMSPDLEKMYNAFCYPLIFFKCVVRDQDPTEFIKSMKFQQFYPYNYEMDKIFQMTNVYHNSRPIVEQNYKKLIEEGKLTKQELGLE